MSLNLHTYVKNNQVSRPTALVLDDYQVITNPAVHSMPGSTMRYLPETLRLGPLPPPDNPPAAPADERAGAA